MANKMEKTPTVSTRDRILEAAKEQFITVGFESASVRAITDRAGANSALLGYYFGSKAQLFGEVIRSIISGIVARRAESLALLRREYPDAIPLDHLVRAYAEPIMTMGHDCEREVAVYLRFFGRLFTEPSDQLIELINAEMIEQQRDYFTEIRKSTSDVDEATLIFRFKLLMGSLAFMGTMERMAAPSVALNGHTGSNDALSRFAQDYAMLLAAPPAKKPPIARERRARSSRRPG
jgi:AcrR family transcriptional regulator